jgi:hypothetical protein
MTMTNEEGGYAYSPGLRFASNGVVALPGTTIDRGRFSHALPLESGFDAVREHLERQGRPIAALCGLELRLPGTLPPDGFRAFNDRYLQQLDTWGLLREGVSPLTRTNVSPAASAPTEPAVLAFSYTAPGTTAAPCFAISGIAELPLAGEYPDGIVRRGESSEDAMVEKAHCVVSVTNGHIESLGLRWEADADVHLYTARPAVHQIVRRALAEQGIAPVNGVIWHDAAPPVSELELEIDVRRYSRELRLDA